MDKLCGPNSKYLSDEQLKQKHEAMIAESVEKFNLRKKFGSEEYREEYRTQLVKELEESFQAYVEKNSYKNKLDVIISVGFPVCVWRQGCVYWRWGIWRHARMPDDAIIDRWFMWHGSITTGRMAALGG